MTQDGRAEELKPVKRCIMGAMHGVLQKHGYGSLTIQYIADKFENSKTLPYYHYDGKDELLVNFFDYVLTQFPNSPPRGDHTPKEELEAPVDVLLPEALPEEAHRFQLSILELRVNAPHDEDCRGEYYHVDVEPTESLWDILVRGVGAGKFGVGDPEAEAGLFLSIPTGTYARWLTAFRPDESVEPLRTAIQPYIDRISA